ncbi:aldo/keto reductase family oxidoreductase [Ammoniphilus sp. CFH 90114]|uniref:aldo/keto reductase n=1 Tax=Ammoniphilus sp. CFH 90114 TaxID=2493665 RepID=UPI00100DB6D6|nr:aldo/keto reductase [Ammoniphilus sp. CFH 90114]RXT07987.1 aldo/keto reductase [Ammoniphilus sp. CFH 90114]
MRVMPLEKRGITRTRILLGCMGFGGGWNADPITVEDIVRAEEAIDVALSVGITMFDHADIYTMGKAEAVFGKILRKQSNLREKIIIQSKCGIRFADEKGPGRYDFSERHIIQSVDGSLQRLGVDYLDVLLLHRPDPLMDLEEVSSAFQQLKGSGKVRYFGVSNMNKAQIHLLQTYCEVPLVVNQLEMSLNKLDWLDQGVLVNQKEGISTHFADGLLEHCMIHNIQIQAWSPLAKGIYSREDKGHLSEVEINTRKLVAKMAVEKDTTKEAIVLGWLMRHPIKIQPVIGTINPERIKNCEDAVRQSELMTREEWYALYVTARGGKLP